MTIVKGEVVLFWGKINYYSSVPPTDMNPSRRSAHHTPLTVSFRSRLFVPQEQPQMRG